MCVRCIYFANFYDFFYLILELFRQTGIFFFSFHLYRFPLKINVAYQSLLNEKEFCISLIGLNSSFSTLPQSEYTQRAVSTPRVRYIRACVYFYLLSIRCFNVVQPETRFHFQSSNQIAKKVNIFQKFQNFKILQKILKFKKKLKI